MSLRAYNRSATPVEIIVFTERRHESLVRRAQEARVALEKDWVRPESWIAREPDVPGYCNIVTPSGCTCREFTGFGDCPHHALLVERLAAS